MNREDNEHLLRACGVRSALTLDIEQPEHHLVDTVSLDSPFATIGRTPGNDVVLDHEQVSRRHAYLQIIDGRIFCIDFTSRTGTHWDGGTGCGWLNDEQCLRIGPYTIRPNPIVRDEDARWPQATDLTDPLRVIAPERDPLPKMTIQFVKGVREQSDWQMLRVLALVGSAPQCKIQLVDPRVSKYHCSLLRTPLGPWVIDLLGRGGIRVNGKYVRIAPLYDGDELKIGGVKTQVACDKLRYMPAIALDLPSVKLDRSPADSPGEVDEPANPADPVIENDQPAVTRGIPPLSTPLVPTAQPVTNLLPHGSARPEYPNLMLAPRGSTDVRVSDQENLVNTLLFHFGQMQRQMTEQFHQAVMTMAQMFSTFHRDQMGLVRAELDRLHALNQEIVAIQSELARRHPPRSIAQTASTRPVTGRPGIATKASDSGEIATMDDRATPTGRNEPGGPRPTAGSGTDRTRRARHRKAPAADQAPAKVTPAARNVQGSRQDESQVPASADSTPEHGSQSDAKPGSAQPAEAPPAEEDVHAWLCQRMEEIREEQQSLWQKILSTVRSTVSGNPGD